MDLDERVRKIATGTSVTGAIEAYLESDERPLDESGYSPDELRAIVEVMFLMAAVDGQVSDRELEQLRSSVAAIVDIERRDRINLDAWIQELGHKLESEGWTSRLRSAASRIQTEDGKAFAFRLAATVAFVDDFVAHAEAAAIDSLIQAFSLDRDTALSLLREVHEALAAG